VGVICDYLSVTYSPELHPVRRVELFLLSLGAQVQYDKDARGVVRKWLYRLGDGGTVTVGGMYGTMRISASGAALAAMRDAGAFEDYLWLLGECPYRVTLLDAALDVETDAPPVLKALQRRYKGKLVYLGRKGLEWTVLMSERPSDGVMTGTFYVGRKTTARATAKVYDKQEEARVRHAKIIAPRLRYEVSVKKDYGATLADAGRPERLFWHVAAPALLPRPADVDGWSPDWAGELEGWRAGSRPELDPVDVLSRRLSRSPELELLTSIADDMGEGGRVWLLRQLASVLGVTVEGRIQNAPQAAPRAADANV
jgi:hypothetical protein